MTTPEFHRFPDDAIARTLDAVRGSHEDRDFRDVQQITPADFSALELRAACISITSRNGKICLDLPLGLGGVCIPVPFDIPDGTAVQACLSIRTIFPGIPTGVCVRLRVAGEQIASRCFP